MPHIEIDNLNKLMYVSLSPSEWEPNGEQFIEELKRRIPHISQDQNGRRFDPHLRRWEIGLTESNKKIIEELRDEYLIDKNQMGLF